MATDPAIRISNLSKAYRIQHQQGHRPTNVGEAVMQRLRNPFGRGEVEEFWALKGIDLEISRGDVVGIIGRNGAGKSTLLKILSRITEPTSGRIELFGRVGALLEVGTGFHPELTGRENVFLNGAILGMRRAEIRKQFDAIVDFAGVEKFLDTPVKRYSSGMYVRLAFSVAAHLNPEILIVDEVLAVGDAEFQKKCLGKMQDVADSGRTVLFVSHNEFAVRQLCRKGIWMRNGSVEMEGDAASVVSQYQEKRLSAQSEVTDRSTQESTIGLRLKAFRLLQDGVETTEICTGDRVECSMTIAGASLPVRWIVNIYRSDGLCVIGLQGDSMAAGARRQVSDEMRLSFLVSSMPLSPSDYYVNIKLDDESGRAHHCEAIRSFKIRPSTRASSNNGVLAIEGEWRVDSE